VGELHELASVVSRHPQGAGRKAHASQFDSTIPPPQPSRELTRFCCTAAMTPPIPNRFVSSWQQQSPDSMSADQVGLPPSVFDQVRAYFSMIQVR
jgi:hypothetical protein